MFVSRATLIDKIKNSDGSIITIEFIRKGDGGHRKMNGRLGVSKFVKGNGRGPLPGQITMYDLQIAKSDPEKAYRTVILDNVFAARINGESFEIT